MTRPSPGMPKASEVMARLLMSAQRLCTAGTVGEAADVLSDGLRMLSGADGCHVFLLDDDGAQTIANSRGTDAQRGTLRVDAGEQNVVRACLESGPVFVPDTATSPLVNRVLCERFGATSVLALPLGDLGGAVLWWHEPCEGVARVVLAVIGQLVTQGTAVLERLRDLETLRGQSLTDPLTGLANRRVLVEHLEALPAGGSVALVDLDHFKRLNDERGHRYGDAVLCRFADALAPLAGAEGCVARYGGEEFALVLPGATPQQVEAALQELRAAWAHEGTFSAGVAATRPGGSPTEALEAADRALYEAKGAGRDRTVLAPETAWEPAGSVPAFAVPQPRSTPDNPVLTLDLLDEALDRGLVVAHYQPAVSAVTGEVVAVEALARLRHPRSGELLQPAQFLPLAERTGRVTRLDELVAEQAIARCASWRRSEAGRDLAVSVNVSVAHLDDKQLPLRLLGQCADRGLPTDALIVEVTETLASERGRGHEQALQVLVDAGVNVTLDDFGTGFASLDYLLRFPVAGLKVDRSFTWALDTPRGQHLVRTLVAMGRDLGLHVVAEGVETVEQLAFLREVGCPFMQGYLLGRPVPASEVPALLGRPVAVPA